MMLIGTIRFMLLGWIEDHYLKPQFHFKYFGFSWVEPLSSAGLYVIHVLLIIAALFVMLGLFYRIAAIMQFLLFTYTELIDLTYYLNHYYFISLVAFLLILVPANRSFSLDAFHNPAIKNEKVPAWTISIFKLQVAIVYIYAGLFKINHDWLIEALPLKIWLPAGDAIPLLGPVFAWEYAPHLFSWIGMVYDTTIVFWLMWSKSRPWAFLSVLVFHVLTGILFQIGVFPVIMIGATLIFFSDHFHQNLHSSISRVFMFRKSHVNTSGESVAPVKSGMNPLLKFFLLGYFTFQILFPWRFVLYPGNMFWTEQGYRFGWRVMLMEKAGTATFYVKDAKSGKEGIVDNAEFLNAHQEKQMAMQPDMILQYAHFLGKYYQKKGVENPQVRAEVYVTLNARPSKLLIDSSIDLMTIRDGWRNKEWIK